MSDTDTAIEGEKSRSVRHRRSSSGSSIDYENGVEIVEDKKGPKAYVDSINNSSFDNAFVEYSLDSIEDYSTISRADIKNFHCLIVERDLDEAVQIIKKAIDEHEGDPCLPHGKLEKLQSLIDFQGSGIYNSCNEYTIKLEAFLIHDWSIYSEVRSATRPIDEEGENYENFRVYFLAILWACLGSALDTFFATRFPTISLDSGSILVMLAMSGKLYSKLPTMYIPWFGGRKFYLNRPEPWSFKEQMLSTLSMTAAVGSPYAIRAIVSQSNSYFLGIDRAREFGYIFMLICASNFMGFGIAGILRQFLVYPTRCVWYNVLPTINVNRVLATPEPRTSVNGWRFKGAEFFGVILLASFTWFWVTNYLFQALSFFDWPAWIAPQNVHLQAITGCMNGLAFNPINTFDWNYVTALAIVTPLFAQIMSVIGAILSMCALIGMWYTNVSWTSFLPINTNVLYANDGTPFDVTKILDSSSVLDEEKYQNYSPPFWSAGVLTNEGGNLMLYTGMVVYSCLNYGKPIMYSLKGFCSSFKSLFTEGANGGLKAYNDRFCRAQRKYKEVPEWWFLGTMCCAIAMAIVMVEYYAFTMTPVWTIFFGIGISLLFSIPFGYLHSTTSIIMDINTLFEMIVGLALPGNPNALMVSKVFASNFFSQSANFVTNQVQAHYTGIAPRAVFRTQVATVMVSNFVKSLLTYWVVSPNGIPDLCNPQNKEKFNCMTQRRFFNAAIQWGAIGPQRLLGGMYPTLKWCFLIGALYPLPFWLARRYIPRFTTKLNWGLHHVHEMAILSGVSWAPFSWQYFFGLTYVCVLFNWFIKTRYPMWWQKYTYTFGHAMDVGVAYAGLVIFFSTQYKSDAKLDWWGNRISFSMGDATGMALRKPPQERGYFGPAKGKFP